MHTPETCKLIDFCRLRPPPQARIRSPSSHHTPRQTLILRPPPPVYEINDKFGKGNKRDEFRTTVKSTTERIKDKTVCAKDHEFLGHG